MFLFWVVFLFVVLLPGRPLLLHWDAQDYPLSTTATIVIMSAAQEQKKILRSHSLNAVPLYHLIKILPAPFHSSFNQKMSLLKQASLVSSLLRMSPILLSRS